MTARLTGPKFSVPERLPWFRLGDAGMVKVAVPEPATGPVTVSQLMLLPTTTAGQAGGRTITTVSVSPPAANVRLVVLSW